MKKEQMDIIVSELIEIEKDPNCHGVTETGETNWNDGVKASSYSYSEYVKDYCRSKGVEEVTKEEMGEIFDRVYLATK